MPTYRKDLPRDLEPGEVDANFEEVFEPKTTTETTIPAGGIYDIPTHHRRIFNVDPATNASSVYATRVSITRFNGPGELLAPGHVLGDINIIEVNANCHAAYATESRFEPIAGHIELAAGFIPAMKTATDGAGGTIAVYADYICNIFEDHDYIGKIYSFWNPDTKKEMNQAGAAFFSNQELVQRQQCSFALNRYYPIAGVQSVSPVATVRGFAIAMPFISPGRKTYNRIGCNLITGVANGSAILGIYEDINGGPGAKILDAGAIALTAGLEGEKEIVINQELNAGVYWLGINVEGDAEPTLTWANTNIYDVIGMVSPLAQHTLRLKGSTASLPATMADSIWYEGVAAPLLWLRESS